MLSHISLHASHCNTAIHLIE